MSLDMIIDYESGNLTDEESVAMFQHLVDTGTVWSLQGSYGRTAMHLIQEGLVTTPSMDIFPENDGGLFE